MVRKFTEEERRRQKEGSERHHERFHSGVLEGTPCNGYAECTKIENAEWAARLKEASDA